MINQSEKHLQSKLEAIESRIDRNLSRLENIPTNYTLIITVVSAVVGGLALVIGVLAYGSDRFNGGAQYVGSTYEQAIDAKRLAQENDDRIKKLSEDNNRQFQIILGILRKRIEEPKTEQN